MGRKKQKSPPPAFATGGTWHTHYTVMFDDQFDSAAYKALSANAKHVYGIIRRQYKGSYTGDRIICSYKKFEKYGVRRETAARAIEQLEAYGFIDITRGGLGHVPNEYRLVDRWKSLSDPEQMIQAEEEFKRRMDLKKRIREQKRNFIQGHTE